MAKQHYYLVAGEVHFRTPDDQLGSVRLNTMLTVNKPAVGLAQIAKAQQALQVNFFQRLDAKDLKVYEVLKKQYEDIGYGVSLVSALKRENTEGLKAILKDKISLVSGSTILKVLPAIGRPWLPAEISFGVLAG